MNKTILAILVGAFLISGAFYLTRSTGEDYKTNNVANEEEVEENNNGETSILIDCLKEKEVVVYGSKTCPACTQLVSEFGGYDVISPIYVECMEERDRCTEEKQTGYVPEIQIKGELYKGGRSPEVIASEVGCII